jgi:hypothetical protein
MANGRNAPAKQADPPDYLGEIPDMEGDEEEEREERGPARTTSAARPRRSPFEKSCIRLFQCDDDITPEALYDLVQKAVLDSSEAESQRDDLMRNAQGEIDLLKRKVTKLQKVIKSLLDDD